MPSSQKDSPKELAQPTGPLDVVVEELGLSVQSFKTGRISDISLQEIAWRPRAALFIAKYGVGVLEDIVLSAEEATKDRIKALELLMSYTYGKAPQKVEHTGLGDGQIQNMVGKLRGLDMSEIELILRFKPEGKMSQDGGYVYPEHVDYVDIEAGEGDNE